jgi:hypothetical protein
MRPWTVAWMSLVASLLPSQFGFPGGKEVAPFTCRVVLVDRQASSWIGGGQGRTSRAASEEAIRNTCDNLPGKERTVCRQQAPMGKWHPTIRKGGDPARPGRVSDYHHVSVEIFKPRSRIHAVGRAVGFLTGRPLEETEGFVRACERAIDQACRLLGAKPERGFRGPPGEVASRPCIGVDWYLADRATGTSANAEGAAFHPDAMSQAAAPMLPDQALQSGGRVGR